MSACVNPSCGAELDSGTKFCSLCGTAQPKAAPPPPAHCSSCGAHLQPGAKFCTTCGAKTPAAAAAAPATASAAKAPSASALDSSPTMPPLSAQAMGVPAPAPRRGASPEALEEYRELLSSFADDGVLDEGELSALRNYARELGVTSADHDRLVGEARLFLGVPIELALDPKTCFLKAGSPSTLSIAVRNRMPSPRDLLREVTLSYRCSTSSRIATGRVRNVAPGSQKQTSFVVDAPPHEGQYRLDGTLEARFQDGRVFRGLFEVPGLMAAGNRAHTGPQSVNLSISGDANMIKGAGLLGGAPQEAQTGEIRTASGTWQTISLEPAPESLLDEWRLQNQDSGSTGMSRAEPGVRGEPIPCRSLLIRIKQQTTRSDASMTRDLWLVRGDAFTLGRDANRADIQAAVEPFTPPELHARNVAQSMRISSLHLQARLTDRGAALTDLGSSNGTTTGGEPVSPRVPLPVAQGMEVTLADALTLRPEVFIGDDGHAHALHIQRVGNVPQRSYALAPGGLGLWPSTYKLIGPRIRDGRRAPVVLDWHLGGLCVRNAGLPGVVRVPFGGAPVRVGVGQRVALDERDRIQLGERWVLFVAEVLLPRPGTF